MLKRKERIGIDVDGTIANTTERWLDIANRMLGRNIQKDDVNVYYLDSLFKIDPQTVNEIFKRVWDDPDSIQLEHNDIPKVIESIRNTFKVYILTATAGNDKKLRSWLRSNEIHFDGLIHVDKSYKKLDEAKRYGISILIDDHSTLVENAAALGYKTILISQPWNRHLDKEVEKRVKIARDWMDVEDLLRSP